MEESTPPSIDQKFDELISLISAARLDTEAKKKMQDKFNTALGVDGYQGYRQKDIPSPFAPGYKLNSRAARTEKISSIVTKVTRMIVALLLIGLGWGMIIMPAPPYFEMFTLFYLNKNDGVTIMDMISLIVAFTGLSLLISTLIKIR